jgi:FtsP/CotA-like multicopper oxidase with cupredoxin domain
MGVQCHYSRASLTACCWPAVHSAGKNNCGQRYTVTAKPGKTQRLRLINAGTLVYMTVCIQAHTLTVVALDAAPVEPQDFFECVDINTGQRCAWQEGQHQLVLQLFCM